MCLLLHKTTIFPFDFQVFAYFTFLNMAAGGIRISVIICIFVWFLPEPLLTIYLPQISVMKKFILLIFVSVLSLFAQMTDACAQREMSREEYISTFAPLAIRQQKEYGIPASIKIAQGMIESRYGNSDLSRRSNNHFGIKCKSNWVGDTVRYDDDARQECFRRYSTIEDSYRDHSEFLKGSPRYERLFRLDPKDYKGWAKGLKECGYATNPHYASILIKCIEDYELYLLDDGELPSYLAGVSLDIDNNCSPVPSLEQSSVTGLTGGRMVDIDNFTAAVYYVADHGVFSDNGNQYIVARDGDSFESLAKDLGVSSRRLKRYNKRNISNRQLMPGDAIYIERPRKG